MEITFSINHQYYTINPKTIPLNTTLNTFIRNHAHLKGTKSMCLEGGCGACIVTVSGKHPITLKNTTWAVNSCLKPIYSCHGLDIMTIEGIGNRSIGHHPLQSRLAQLNGTQCGYCSPGIVMNMYSLMESFKGQLTMKEIENSFGGNICRCTGYRSILDSFKTFATDADQKYLDMVKDIEDLDKNCPKTGLACNGMCNKKDPGIPIHLKDGDREWIKLYTLRDLFTVFRQIGQRSYILLAGNTAHGVYRMSPQIKVFIDVSTIYELRQHKIGETIEIGGGVSLTETMEILNKAATQNENFKYCEHLVKHIDLIANVPVRNSGTIAGNLSIKYQHNEFPSDMFIILESCGGKVKLYNGDTEFIITPKEYLKYNMNKTVIKSIIIPPLNTTDYIFRSFKIMPRAQNAHAYVNTGILTKHKNGIVESISICYGGMNPTFVHAIDTENFLIGKQLFDNETLQETFKILDKELILDWMLPDANPQYRKQLAISLFYKFVLNVCPDDKIDSIYKSGGSILERPISSGTQTFDTYQDRWPLTKSVPKSEALIQCSGEAQYANDINNQPGELWAAFVQGKEIHGEILSIDPSEALAIPGVVAFYSAKDIPGKNNFTPTTLMTVLCEEKIFADTTIMYNGQPVGVILANSFELANYAANKVKINCKPTGQKIIPTIKRAFELDAKDRFKDYELNLVAEYYGTDIDFTIKGHMEMGTQYHFTMEPQTTVCIPNEEHGLDVICATQWIDFTQIAISQCLNLPENKINMTVKRLGGGYGGKGSRCSMVACAAALASYKIQRPVRFVLTLEANMTAIGRRYACISDYEVEVNKMGKIQRLTNRCAEDAGCYISEPVQAITVPYFKNCYDKRSFDMINKTVVTDATSHTFCRGPGGTEAIAMIETIMEHIAHVTGVDPIDVRMANIPPDNPVIKHATDFIAEIDFYNRRNEIDELNSKNRWIKRGIALTFMDYQVEFFGALNALVSIYHQDGTVAISHGGVEMGQGMNTKAAQVAAHVLDIPLEYISVKPTNNLINANASCTGGSQTSEAVCYAVKYACEILLERIKPMREKMPEAKWPALAHACYDEQIDLTARYQFRQKDVKNYPVYGVTCAETEIDLLTGNLIVRRVDLLEDTGESMNPLIDIGQVEGAFMMGLGYWLTEQIVYNEDNGELLTNRSWNYKPPGPKDIPVDFRVKFVQKTANPSYILRSKATGEPAICMSVVIISSLRYALRSAQKDAGLKDDWIELGAPSTPEYIFAAAKNAYTQYLLHK